MAPYTTSENATGKRRWSGHDLRDSLKGAIRLRQSHRCAYCGKVAQNGHIDHVQPRILGGANTADNLVWSCRPCNLAKSDTPVETWLARRPKTLMRVRAILAEPVDRVAGRVYIERRKQVVKALSKGGYDD